jgi:hypothetical protein
MLSSLLIAGVCVFNGFLDSDTTSHSQWHIGYQNGLSARYFFQNNLGLGLNLQPVDYDLYSESSGDDSYTWQDTHTERSEKSKSRGAQLFAEVYYQKKINRIFLFTPFLSIGGGFGTDKSYYITSHKVISTDSTIQYSYDNRENTTTLFSGSAGVMPGIKLGRFTAEFRLGIAAYYSKMTSPEGATDKSNRTSKRAMLIYPSDFIRAIILHFNI